MPFMPSRQAAYSQITVVVATFAAFAGSQARAQSVAVSLGQAASFGVLAGSTVTNTGTSTIFGNAGVSPGTSMTGFSTVTMVGGTQQVNNTAAQNARADLATAYGAIAGETPTQILSGTDLGTLVLTPGVYEFASSAQLTGPLTLNAQGNSNARFDFLIGSTLTTATASSVLLTNGASANNVYWQVGSSATLGTSTAFEGNILAQTNITLMTGATDIGGRILARNGAVTMDANIIGNATRPVPEFGTLMSMGMMFTGGGLFSIRRRKRHVGAANSGVAAA